MQTWDEIKTELCTPEELSDAAEAASAVSEIIRVRNEAGADLYELARRIGIDESEIAAMDEGGYTELKFGTVIKLLSAMGNTFKAVPKERNIEHRSRRQAVKTLSGING